MSCIMHSSRVGDLKTHRVVSVYFGLTNSGTTPPEASSTLWYIARSRTNVFTFPGNGENPLAPGSSPLPRDSFKRGSSWLYSTFIVSGGAPGLVNLQMEPVASPGFRGMLIEFMPRPRSTATPMRLRTFKTTRACVSCMKQTCVFPCDFHFSVSPVEYRSWCTSPCPWGFVTRLNPSPSVANAASFPDRAGTLPCFMRVTCPGAMPKLPFASSSCSVAACVSPEVMMARGTGPPAFDSACHARMY
eukprot:gene11518-biopygen11574